MLRFAIVIAALMSLSSSLAAADARESESAASAELARPLHLPHLKAGAACPISKAQPAALTPGRPARSMPAVGTGPVYPLTVGGSQPGTLTLGVELDGWRGQKTPWIADRSYRGRVLIRGGRIDRPGVMRFAFAPGQHFVALHWPTSTRTGIQSSGWRAWPSVTLVKTPGCYAYQIDGTTFSKIVVIRAIPFTR